MTSLTSLAYAADDAVTAARAALNGLLDQEATYLALCNDLPRDLALALGDAEAALAQAEAAAQAAWQAEDDEYWREYPNGYSYYKWEERQRVAEWYEELAARC